MSNEKIHGMLEKMLGKKVHFNASGSSDPDAAWLQYCKKHQNAEKVELILWNHFKELLMYKSLFMLAVIVF
jgi:hypothetical protein